MIVEFSGSPASGKTSIASRLYDQGYYPFRLSSKSRWQRVTTLLIILSFPFFKQWRNSFFVLKNKLPNLHLRRVLILSALGAMTYVLARRDDIYIKDQGFFQFSDWVKQGKATDLDYLATTLTSIKAQPDIVVFFNLPPELIVSRMKQRGDYLTWRSRALTRGYKNVVSRLEDQNHFLDIKYSLCDKLNIPYIVVDVDDAGKISTIDRSSKCGETSFGDKKIDDLEREIVNAWKCTA